MKPLLIITMAGFLCAGIPVLAWLIWAAWVTWNKKHIPPQARTVLTIHGRQHVY